MKGLGYFTVAVFSFLCAIGFLEMQWCAALPFAVLGAICFALGLPIGEPKPSATPPDPSRAPHPAERRR